MESVSVGTNQAPAMPTVAGSVAAGAAPMGPEATFTTALAQAVADMVAGLKVVPTPAAGQPAQPSADSQPTVTPQAQGQPAKPVHCRRDAVATAKRPATKTTRPGAGAETLAGLAMVGVPPTVAISPDENPTGQSPAVAAVEAVGGPESTVPAQAAAGSPAQATQAPGAAPVQSAATTAPAQVPDLLPPSNVDGMVTDGEQRQATDVTVQVEDPRLTPEGEKVGPAGQSRQPVGVIEVKEVPTPRHERVADRSGEPAPGNGGVESKQQSIPLIERLAGTIEVRADQAPGGESQATTVEAARGGDQAASGQDTPPPQLPASQHAMAKSDAQPANGNPPLPQEVVWHRPASDHRPVVTAPRLSSGDGRAEFTATLEPEALGKMDVHVTVRDGAVRVALAPERPAVAQVVEAQLPQLRSALEHQGLHLASLDVNGSALAAAGRDTRQRHGRDPAQPERARTREVEAVGGTHSRRAEAKATGPLGLDVRV